MISPSFLDDLRSRVTLSSVVGRRVKLVKKGREHHGLCPVHNEKTPSFTVNDDKGFAHCFGCGFHADAIEFVQRVYGRSFVEAVEELAAEVGLEVPKATAEERAQSARQASLYEAVEAACAWFERQLTTTKAGAEGLMYLHRRGVDSDTIARFRLGWAPTGDALRRALPADRFPDDLLIEAGLLRRREDGTLAALFRGRVTFPIMDRRGRVIGFGARTLSAAEDVPKYLNSPDTPLFRKGEVLYGLSHARDGAATHKCAVVTEGYLDVIRMHQAGLAYAVAPLGTALTEGQIEEVWRLAAEPIVCLDGDEAGARAMRKAAERSFYRHVHQSYRAYEAAKVGRRTDGWIAGNASANAEIGPALSRLRARARDLARNTEIGANAVRKLSAHMVGTGITPRLVSDDEAERRASADRWRAFSESCDPEDLTDFGGKQLEIAQCVVESGTALLRFLPRPSSWGMRVPLQVQVLEPDYVDMSKNEVGSDGSVVIQGAEYDSFGRRVATWMFEEHPGDTWPLGGGRLKSKRYTMDEVRPIFHRLRPGQVWGVPWFFPVVIRRDRPHQVGKPLHAHDHFVLGASHLASGRKQGLAVGRCASSSIRTSYSCAPTGAERRLPC